MIIFTIYLIIGIIIGIKNFKYDLKTGVVFPMEEYCIRLPLFWLVDLIYETFFNYGDDIENLES